MKPPGEMQCRASPVLRRPPLRDPADLDCLTQPYSIPLAARVRQSGCSFEMPGTPRHGIRAARRERSGGGPVCFKWDPVKHGLGLEGRIVAGLGAREVRAVGMGCGSFTLGSEAGLLCFRSAGLSRMVFRSGWETGMVAA